MQISLKYGKTAVRMQIRQEHLVGVVKPKQSIKRGQDLQASLAKPIGTEPLPHVLQLLKRYGIPRDSIRILIGTGTHRGHTPAERREILGRQGTSIPHVIDHTMEPVQYIGTTKRGTRVSVNPNLLDVDFALAVGNVDVHYFAGYTGGYKAVIPGLAGKETIERNHSLMTLPNAEPGVVELNPVREDFEEAGQLTALRYIVNVVLDERNRTIAAFSGDPIAAQRRAIRAVDDFVKVPIKERADIVLASAGGYPRDINLYQAHKAIENASHAVKNGGTVIVLAECGEGFGNTTFEDWMVNASNLDEIGRKLSDRFILGAHKAYALSKIAKRAQIYLVSDKMREASSILFKGFKSSQDALEDAWSSHGKDASILLMPYAMSTLPSRSS